MNLLACHYARVPHFPVDGRCPPAVMADLLTRAGLPSFVLVSDALTDAAVPPGTQRVEEPMGTTAPTGAGTSPGGDDSEVGLLVFTFGSTGSPKGVALDWSTVNARWRRRLTEPGHRLERRRSTAILPLDSAWGLNTVTAISAGYSVLIADSSRLRPSDLIKRIAAFGTTHLEAPPQLVRVIAQLPHLQDLGLPDLEFLRVGPEALRYEFLSGIRRLAPPEAVIEHSFGATESGWVFRHQFPIGAAPEEGIVPLGEPVVAEDVRLDAVDGLDARLREVVVTGAIAREYLGDPHQTKGRFTFDADGRRWWRSGDLVARSEDGLYRHEGRMDDVVKVSGRLASPAQAVAALVAIDGIRDAVVLPYEKDHNVRLVAHVELQPDSDLSLEEVRLILARDLPAHLVPSAVMRHRTLPTTKRGKVDRQALTDGPFESW